MTRQTGSDGMFAHITHRNTSDLHEDTDQLWTNIYRIAGPILLPSAVTCTENRATLPRVTYNKLQESSTGLISVCGGELQAVEAQQPTGSIKEPTPTAALWFSFKSVIFLHFVISDFFKFKYLSYSLTSISWSNAIHKISLKCKYYHFESNYTNIITITGF